MRVPFTTRLDKKLITQLKIQAAIKGVYMNDILEDLIGKYIEEKNSEENK